MLGYLGMYRQWIDIRDSIEVYGVVATRLISNTHNDVQCVDGFSND